MTLSPGDRNLDRRLRDHFAAMDAPLPDEVVMAARARVGQRQPASRQRLLLTAAALGALAVAVMTLSGGNPTPELTTPPSATSAPVPTTTTSHAEPSPSAEPGPQSFGGTWRVMSPAPIPGSYGASGIWTGSEFIVWGGHARGGVPTGGPDDENIAVGAAYNPTTDRWRTIAASPLGYREGHDAAWTGREMLVWGGNDRRDNPQPSATGAAYDPASDSWRPIPMAPVAGGMAIWTGRELVVFGAAGDLAAFDPQRNRWRSLPTPSIVDGYVQYVIWSGSELLVFVAPDGIDSAVQGYRLDPATGRFATLAPSPWWALYAAPIIWAGDRAVSLGQYPQRSPSGLTGSVSYDPAADQWRFLGTCSAGVQHAVGTGAHVLGDHSAYDIARDVCLPLPKPPDRPYGKTTGREASAFAWTGREYLIWSGGDGSDRLTPGADGLVFTPVASGSPATPAAPSVSQWGPLAVVPRQDGTDLTRLEGTLRITDSCVVLEEWSGEKTLLIWHDDQTWWNPQTRSITFRNFDGTIVTKRDGDHIVLGGSVDTQEESGITPAEFLARTTWVARPGPSCPLDRRWDVGIVGT
jgi:hypothetical protein